MSEMPVSYFNVKRSRKSTFNIDDNKIRNFVKIQYGIKYNKYNKDLSWPRISIITPSYNQSEYLERTILSIINQNYPNLEFIIIDGGSTDGSVSIIEKYNDFIDFFVSEKDRGQSHALNKGLEHCSGVFVGWMNSDDIYLPGAFKKLVDISMCNQNYDIYYANKINIDNDDQLLRSIIYAYPALGYMKFYAKYRGMTFCNQAAFFRLSALKQIGLFDENFNIGMDRDYFYRCIIMAMNFYYVNDFWGAWRDHGAAKTSSLYKDTPIRVSEKAMFVKKHCLYRGLGYSLLNFTAGIWRRVILLAQSKSTFKELRENF